MARLCATDTEILQYIVRDEIARRIAAALKAGASFDPRDQAQRLTRLYPHSGLSETDIMEAMHLAAVTAGVVVGIVPQKPRNLHCLPWKSIRSH